jgi:hypothetical protein
MSSTLAMAMVLPPCNLVSHLGLISKEEFPVYSRDEKYSEADSSESLRAVEATTSAPDGTPLVAVGCGSMIAILSPIDGAVGLSVVSTTFLLVEEHISPRTNKPFESKHGGSSLTNFSKTPTVTR